MDHPRVSLNLKGVDGQSGLIAAPVLRAYTILSTWTGEWEPMALREDLTAEIGRLRERFASSEAKSEVGEALNEIERFVAEYAIEPVPQADHVDRAELVPAARALASWIGYAWNGMDRGRISDRGHRPWVYAQFGGQKFQGGQADLIDMVAAVASKVKGDKAGAGGSAELLGEVGRLRPHYQTSTSTDQARRQLLDHFEKFGRRGAEPTTEPLLPVFAPGQVGSDLLEAAERYLDGYVYSTDDTEHVPNEFERGMMEDFSNGFLSQPDVNGILQKVARSQNAGGPDV